LLNILFSFVLKSGFPILYAILIASGKAHFTSKLPWVKTAPTSIFVNLLQSA